jgi:hypothetical protein
MKVQVIFKYSDTYRGSLIHEVLDVLLRLLAIFIVVLIFVIPSRVTSKIVLTGALHLNTFGHLLIVSACGKTVLRWGDRFA